MKIKQAKSSKKIILTVIAILIALGLIGGGVFYYVRVWQPEQNKKNFGSETTTPNTDQPKSESTQESESTNLNSPKDNGKTDDGKPVAPPSTTQPSTPIGIFVSNHFPNLSGSPAPNTLSSTCSTTVGVQCYIEFKNGSITKSLESKQTDTNGNVTWNWKLQDVGLTAGSWTVTAVAKNGSLTASSTDPMKLEVKP